MGGASITALSLVSAYLYFSRSSSGLSCQQSMYASDHLRFGIDEQNRLIEAIYQVRGNALVQSVENRLLFCVGLRPLDIL